MRYAIIDRLITLQNRFGKHLRPGLFLKRPRRRNVSCVSNCRRASGIIRNALVPCLFLAGFANAQDRGLHNDTKTFVHPSQMRSSDWSSPAEMHRTWLAAIVRVPTGKKRSRRINAKALAKWSPRRGGKVPAVVYLHGCSGIWSGSRQRVKFMADLGFVVAAPASLARKKYAQSCDVKTHTGGMYREVSKIRLNDAAYAIAQLRKLPFVDGNRIVIMGLSEGAITTAKLRAQPGEAARIIEGWTCHSGWPEQKGLNARASTPVLSLVGAQDPWFQTKWLRGDCGRFMKRSNGSRSVVFNSGRLRGEHELLDHAEPRREVVRFLTERRLIP